MKKVLILLEGSRAYDRGIMRGIAKYSETHGPWEFYQNPLIYRRNIIRFENISSIRELAPDGIIMREPENPERLLELDIPAIICPYTSEIIEGIPNIITDPRAIGEIAAEHLIGRGFKNFGFCGFDEFAWSHDRGRCFADSISRYGYEVNFYGPRKGSSGKNLFLEEKESIAEWISSLEKPSAILTCNDDRGRHVCEACKRANIKVPEEIAVLGIDNDNLVCELSTPPLSSIEMNSFKGGFDAAALLDSFMNGTQSPGDQKILVSPTMVAARVSTNIIAIEDREVSNALKFIRDHAREPIQVHEVVEAAATAKRTLQRKFKNQIGKTIHRHIRDARIHEIKKLLLETHMSASEIAVQMNFTGIEHLSRFFRQETGSSISGFRKKHRAFK